MLHSLNIKLILNFKFIQIKGKILQLHRFLVSKMAGLELLSDQGFRVDGRRPHELRKIQCRLGVFGQADGSAYLEMGNTKVLAAVYGPHEVS